MTTNDVVWLLVCLVFLAMSVFIFIGILLDPDPRGLKGRRLQREDGEDDRSEP